VASQVVAFHGFFVGDGWVCSHLPSYCDATIMRGTSGVRSGVVFCRTHPELTCIGCRRNPEIGCASLQRVAYITLSLLTLAVYLPFGLASSLVLHEFVSTRTGVQWVVGCFAAALTARGLLFQIGQELSFRHSQVHRPRSSVWDSSKATGSVRTAGCLVLSDSCSGMPGLRVHVSQFVRGLGSVTHPRLLEV